MADTEDLKSSELKTLVGSTPTSRTTTYLDVNRSEHPEIRANRLDATGTWTLEDMKKFHEKLFGKVKGGKSER